MTKRTLKSSVCAKFVSWVTLACFTGTLIPSQAVFGMTTLASEGRQARQAEKQDDGVVVPHRYGRITNGKFAGGQRLVVYIQDLHCNPEVQNNIAKILESLDTKAGINKIFLEGAPAGKVNASLFDTVSDTKIRAGAIDRLLNKGLLSGAEYYALKFNQNKLYGMEDWGAYTANLVRYRNLFAARQENRKTVGEIEKKIARLKWQYLDKKIKRIEKAFKQEQSESRYARIEKLGARVGEPIGGYPNLSRYVELMKLNRAIRRKHVNEEMASYVRELRKAVPMAAYMSLLDKMKDSENTDEYYRQLGDMGNVFAPALAIRYPGVAAFFTSLRLQYQINPLQLIDEENEFQDRVLAKYAERALDKDLVFLSRMAEDLGSFAELKMTPNRYAYFDRNKQHFKVLLQKYFDDAETSAALAILDNEEYPKFYAVNLQRNDIFIKSVVSAAKAKNATAMPSVATRSDGFDAMLSRLSQFKEIDVVVAGGFHLDVVKKLKDIGVSCLMITPNVTRQYDQSIYEQVMTGTIDLRNVASSALAPVILLSGVDESRKAAEIEALFAGATSLKAAEQVINDLTTDPRYVLKAVTDEAGKRIDIRINEKIAFSLEIDGTAVRVIAGASGETTVAHVDVQAEMEAATAAAVAAVQAYMEPVLMSNPGKTKPSGAQPRKSPYGKTTLALLRMIKDSFGKKATPQIVVSDMDESLVAAGGVIAEEMIEALIAYLESGGIFVILTGNSFPLVEKAVLNIFVPVLQSREKTHLLNNFHIMTNSGAERFEYNNETGEYVVVEQADMTFIIGRGDSKGQRMADGRQKVKKIYEIINDELISDAWLETVEKNPELLNLIRKELQQYMDDMAKSSPAQFEHLTALYPDLGMAGLRDMKIGDQSATEDRPVDREDLTVQIAFIPPGRTLNPEEKKRYDTDGGALKRRAYAVYMNWRFRQEAIPVSAKVGGTTSIDIKPLGQDKAFGLKAIVQYLADQLGEDSAMLLKQAVYIGDSLDSMGNDTPAALVAGTVIHVRQPGAGEPDERIKGKLIGTVEMGVDSLVPYIRAMSFVAAIRTALREGTYLASDFDWRSLPASLKKTYELFFSGQANLHGSILPVRILAYISLVWGAMGSVTMTPFLRMIYTDLALAEALPGKAVLRVVPAVNPSHRDLATVLNDLRTIIRKNGMLGVAVALSASSEKPEGTAAGKIVVRLDDEELLIPVVHQEDEAGDILLLQVPERYLRGKSAEEADAFLKKLYPVALHALVDELTHGDIIAETTGIVPWLVEMNGLELNEENSALFGALPVVIAKSAAPYEKLARKFKEILLKQRQIKENNTGAGVMKQGALMIRADITRVNDPIGDAKDTATKATNFVAQFKGVSDVQFDGLLRANKEGMVSEEMPQVVAAMKDIKDGRIVLSLELPPLPQGAAARADMAVRIAEGISHQLKGHKGLGIRLMFEEQPSDEAFQSFVSRVADSMVSMGIAPETTLIVDTKNKAQADAVRKVSMESGMSGLKAIESVHSVKSASESSGDAVEVTIRLGDSDMPMPREELIAIMSSPNAQLVVLHLDGETPAVGEQGVILNLGMICAAVTEYISFRQPSDPAWWKERGAQGARGTFADIMRLTEGQAAPATLRALANALMRVMDNGANLKEAMGALDKDTQDILDSKLEEMHELIDKGEDTAARAIRNEMIAGFMETLLGEVLYRQMPEIAGLKEKELQKNGDRSRIVKFLADFARSAGDDSVLAVKLMKIRSGILPVLAENEKPALAQSVVDYVNNAHTVKPAIIYSILNSAEALGLDLKGVRVDKEALGEMIRAGSPVDGTAEALLAEYLQGKETLDALRNKIAAFLNRTSSDSMAQAIAMDLYMTLLKAEFDQGPIGQGAEIAAPAIDAIQKILSAA